MVHDPYRILWVKARMVPGSGSLTCFPRLPEITAINDNKIRRHDIERFPVDVLDDELLGQWGLYYCALFFVLKFVGSAHHLCDLPFFAKLQHAGFHSERVDVDVEKPDMGQRQGPWRSPSNRQPRFAMSTKIPTSSLDSGGLALKCFV